MLLSGGEHAHLLLGGDLAEQDGRASASRASLFFSLEIKSKVDENMKAQESRLLMVQDKQRLQSKCLELKQRTSALSRGDLSLKSLKDKGLKEILKRS